MDAHPRETDEVLDDLLEQLRERLLGLKKARVAGAKLASIVQGLLRASNGEKFSWRPLIISQHVLAPAKDNANYHCQECPLAQQPAAPATPATTGDVALAKDTVASL